MQEIRSGWSASEAEAKYCGRKHQRWEIPTIHYDARLDQFYD